ncbi:MAG: hypothetical protein IJA14_01660 [Alphaproteobacteria bacterium]|nr:hypothetical protein [Alphaproteobacteria bacterium]
MKTNKLITASVLSVALSIKALDAMKLPTWRDPAQTSNSHFSTVSLSQTCNNQTSLSEIMKMLQSMQSSIQNLAQNIQNLSLRLRELEEQGGIFEFADELAFIKIRKLSAAYKSAIAMENKDELEMRKNALVTRVKAYTNEKLSPFCPGELVDKKVAVQILRAVEQLGYAYVRTSTNIIDQYFEESSDLLLQDLPTSYRITREIGDQLGFQIRDYKMYKS